MPAPGRAASTITGANAALSPVLSSAPAAHSGAIRTIAAASIRACAQPPIPFRCPHRSRRRSAPSAPRSKRGRPDPVNISTRRTGSGLGLGKSSVPDVSNPCDSGWTIADPRPALKVGPKDRLYWGPCAGGSRHRRGSSCAASASCSSESGQGLNTFNRRKPLAVSIMPAQCHRGAT